MMGAMLFVIANGSGPMSVDSRLRNPTSLSAEKRETLVHAMAV